MAMISMLGRHTGGSAHVHTVYPAKSVSEKNRERQLGTRPQKSGGGVGGGGANPSKPTSLS